MSRDAESSNSGIVIRSAASGEEVVRLAADDLPVRAGTGSISVCALKQVLAKRINLSRFRQRLLTDGGELLHDDIQLSPPLILQLVKLELLKPDKTRDKDFIDACAQNRVAEVEGMLCGLQDPNTMCDDGQEEYLRALHVAAQNGCVAVVDRLLEAGANTETCDNCYQATPLHLAARHGHTQVVRVLLESGTDKDKSGPQEATPLLWATENGNLEVVRLLLESGADKEKPDHLQKTPLYWAACEGQLEVVSLLLQSGADKNKGNVFGSTPLHSAACFGHLKIVRLLLESGADKEACEIEGRTPLHLAAQYGRLEIARLLLEGGADRNRCMGNGRLPVHLAAFYGHGDVEDLLRSYPSFKRNRR